MEFAIYLYGPLLVAKFNAPLALEALASSLLTMGAYAFAGVALYAGASFAASTASILRSEEKTETDANGAWRNWKGLEDAARERSCAVNKIMY